MECVKIQEGFCPAVCAGNNIRTRLSCTSRCITDSQINCQKWCAE